jgi:hypothetical protein
MRKRKGAMLCIISSLLVMSAVGLARADEGEHNFHLNFTGGMNSARMSGSEIDSWEELKGFDAYVATYGRGEITLSVPLSHWLNVEAGLGFGAKGFRIPEDISYGYTWISTNDSQTVREYAFYLLELPILIKPNLIFHENEYGFYVSAGIKPGLVIAAKETEYLETKSSYYVSGTTNDDSKVDSTFDLFEDRTVIDGEGNEIAYSYDDFYRRFDLSLLVGVGFQKMWGTIGIAVGGLFDIGLLNMRQYSDDALDDIEDAIANSTTDEPLFLDGSPEMRFRTLSLSLTFFVVIPSMR